MRPYFYVKENGKMNLVEKLLAVDKKEFDKIERKEIPSGQLSKIGRASCRERVLAGV